MINLNYSFSTNKTSYVRYVKRRVRYLGKCNSEKGSHIRDWKKIYKIATRDIQQEYISGIRDFKDGKWIWLNEWWRQAADNDRESYRHVQTRFLRDEERSGEALSLKVLQGDLKSQRSRPEINCWRTRRFEPRNVSHSSPPLPSSLWWRTLESPLISVSPEHRKCERRLRPHRRWHKLLLCSLRSDLTWISSLTTSLSEICTDSVNCSFIASIFLGTRNSV